MQSSSNCITRGSNNFVSIPSTTTTTTTAITESVAAQVVEAKKIILLSRERLTTSSSQFKDVTRYWDTEPNQFIVFDLIQE